MANTVPQHPTMAQWTSGVTSKAATYGSACTSGSKLIALACHAATAAGHVAWTVSDPTNGAWTQDANIDSGGTSPAVQGQVSVFSVNNTASTALTVTLANINIAANDGYLKIFEVIGNGGAALVYDNSAGYGTFPPANPIAISFARAAGSFVAAGCVAYSNTLAGADSGFTIDGPTAGGTAYFANEYVADAGSAGTQTIDWNGSSAPSAVYCCLAASYKVSGTDTAINPGVGTLTFTGYAPAVSQSGSQSVSPGVGSMTITGYAPTVARTTNVTLTTPVIKNNTGTVLSNETGAAINIYNSTTGALVLRKTSQTTDSSGIMTVTDGTSTLVSGTTYAYEVVLATAGRRLPVATTT